MSGDEIRELVAELDGHPNDAEDAQAGLAHMGPAILQPLLDAAPSFETFGRLCAIELFQGLGDPRAADVLITMLGDPVATVRAWAAEALGELGVVAAIPALRTAYEAVRRRGTPLDHSEPQSLRSALTRLGGRAEVIPPRVLALSRHDAAPVRSWRFGDLAEVLGELARARQVVLSVQCRRGRGDRRFLAATPVWQIDWSRS